MRNPLVIGVTDLLHQPAHRRQVSVAVPVATLQVTDDRLDPNAEIAVEVLLSSLTEGIMASGTVSVAWIAPCRRCLTEVRSTSVSELAELYSTNPGDEFVGVIVGDQLDLTDAVRELVIAGLPLAPLCRTECAGLCPSCGTDRNEIDCGHAHQGSDSRWAALESLRFQLDLTDE
jgi:uncharacterized protein